MHSFYYVMVSFNNDVDHISDTTKFKLQSLFFLFRMMLFKNSNIYHLQSVENMAHFVPEN